MMQRGYTLRGWGPCFFSKILGWGPECWEKLQWGIVNFSGSIQFLITIFLSPEGVLFTPYPHSPE